MGFFDFLKPPKRGYMYIEAVGGGLLNKGKKYKGNYEVEILEETKEMFKIEFIDLPVHRPMWVEKGLVTVIKPL